MNPKVDKHIANLNQWMEGIETIRQLLIDSKLEEDYKWKQPCYTLDGKNVALLFTFKEYCGISFLKGALINDPKNLMDRPGPNTNAARIFKFYSLQEVKAHIPDLTEFINQAINIERKGLVLPESEKLQIEIPEELEAAFQASDELARAFEALTPGRQKGYLLFFNGAKGSATRVARIEKYWDRILSGKGFHDCVCGLSKRMPSCDGSHKNLKPK